MIITISGSLGSGKSTVAKILAKKLQLTHHSLGDLQRELAKEKGLTLEELGELEKKDKTLDNELDDKQKKLGEEEDGFVIDGRLSFHFIPHSLKVYIDADESTRAERILQEVKKGNRDEEKASDVQGIIRKMRTRKKLEIERFGTFYNVNPHDTHNYDLLIDSTDIPAEEVAEKIIEFVNKKTYK